MKEALDRCYEMAAKLASGCEFDRELHDELFDFAYENGIELSEDLWCDRPFVEVEDTVYYFQYQI